MVGQAKRCVMGLPNCF